MTPAQLTALREHRDAETRRSELLFREGQYGAAIEVRQALSAELERTLKDVPEKAQQSAYLATSVEVLKNDLAELEPLARWALSAGADPQAAGKLVLALLHPRRSAFDGYQPAVKDPQVQKWLKVLRALDSRAARQLGPRKVWVVVTGGEASSSAYFAGELVAALKALGLDASTAAGHERLEVELKFKGPVSAHLLGDDVDECALVAVAQWTGGDLARLDLTAHGFGDEETEGDCFRARVRQSVALAAEQVIRSALGWPLATNLNKAEGPNGVFR